MIEDLNTEFKREYTEDIKYSVLAFANTDGGTIFIGMDDDGIPCGINDIDGTMLKLTNMIRDSIHPDVTLFTDCRAKKIGDKDIIILKVNRGTSKPYYLHSKGIRPSGIYVRQGASSVPASETAIMNLILDTYSDSYEDSISANQNLTFTESEKYFAMKDIPFGAPQKRSMHLMNADGAYTNLGMLLSDQCVHDTKLAVMSDDSNTSITARMIFTGSILKQADEVCRFITPYNTLRAEFKTLWREDQKAYPDVAIRETILNAIVHRDYSLSSSTLISIHKDRIECLSYGRLVHGIEMDDLGSGISLLRNPHLGNILYRLNLVEQFGTGILKIRNSYEGTGLTPEIKLTSNTFRMILPNINNAREDALREKESIQNMFFYDKAPSYMTEREKAVLEMLARKGRITRKEVDSLLEISQTTSSLLLKEMVKSGMIEKKGNGPSSVYMLRKK